MRGDRRAAGGRSRGNVSTTDGGPETGSGGFSPGDKVVHSTFGEGVVVSSAVRDGDEEVVVAFAGAGVKKLLQSFARLRRA
jgi:DNA helicase-2/ATP-dependent DNA helicase PcrA